MPWGPADHPGDWRNHRAPIWTIREMYNPPAARLSPTVRARGTSSEVGREPYRACDPGPNRDRVLSFGVSGLRVRIALVERERAPQSAPTTSAAINASVASSIVSPM